MAEFDPAPNPIEQLYRRSVAALLYHTRLLDTFRRLNVTSGRPAYRIIRYQRIIDPDKTSFPLAKDSYVRPETFAEHARYLSEECNVIPLDALFDKLIAGETIAPNTAAITFDGGYLDNYENAFPLLKEYQLPASIFLPTAFIGTMNMFWQEKVLVSLLIMQSANLPFPPLPFFEEGELADLFRQVTVKDEINLANIGLLIEYLSSISPEERLAVFTVLARAAESITDVETERTFLSWDEVREMQQSGITFGSAGHGHLRLDETSVEEITSDLNRSFQELLQQKVAPLTSFCFPEGIVTRDSLELLQGVGFTQGLTIGELPAPDLKKKDMPLFGRVDMYQAVSYCKEVFACRLWGMRVPGARF